MSAEKDQGKSAQAIILQVHIDYICDDLFCFYLFLLNNH